MEKYCFYWEEGIISTQKFNIVNSLRSAVSYLFQQKRRKMKEQGSVLAINSILFESNDPEVLIKGKMSKGVMSYETELIITHSQLNIIFNNLQKQNNDIMVGDLLKSEKMYNDEFLYSADFSNLSFNNIHLNTIQGNQPLKQIRA